MHVRYTSIDGGDKLKKVAEDALLDYIDSVDNLSREEGLFTFFDLAHDFPDEWYQATHPAPGATERVLNLGKLNERLPLFTKGRDPKKIVASDI